MGAFISCENSPNCPQISCGGKYIARIEREEGGGELPTSAIIKNPPSGSGACVKIRRIGTNGGDGGEGTNGKGSGARAAALVDIGRFNRKVFCPLGYELPFGSWSPFLSSSTVLDNWVVIVGRRQTKVGTLRSSFAPGVLIRIGDTLVFIALDDERWCFGWSPSICRLECICIHFVCFIL